MHKILKSHIWLLELWRLKVFETRRNGQRENFTNNGHNFMAGQCCKMVCFQVISLINVAFILYLNFQWLWCNCETVRQPINVSNYFWWFFQRSKIKWTLLILHWNSMKNQINRIKEILQSFPIRFVEKLDFGVSCKSIIIFFSCKLKLEIQLISHIIKS